MKFNFLNIVMKVENFQHLIIYLIKLQKFATPTFKKYQETPAAI